MNTNTNKRKSLLATMVGLMAAVGLSTAAAQEAESARAQGILDEIIVTSTRRAESLNDAALSVAAIGAFSNGSAQDILAAHNFHGLHNGGANYWLAQCGGQALEPAISMLSDLGIQADKLAG